MSTSFIFCAILLLSAVRSCADIHEIRETPLQDVGERWRVESEAMLPVRVALRPNANGVAKAEQWLMVRLSNLMLYEGSKSGGSKQP